MLSDKALLYTKLGKYEEAKKYLDEAELHLVENTLLFNLMVAYNKSCIMSIRNNCEGSLNLLGQILRLGPIYKYKAKKDPDFNNIKNDPRFQKMIQNS